jgi:hypothetical protein
MPESTIEDLIFERADEERTRGAGGISFAPLYAFMATVAHMARMDERQTILDRLPKDRAPDKSQEWNDGYNAALTAIIRACVERAHTH